MLSNFVEPTSEPTLTADTYFLERLILRSVPTLLSTHETHLFTFRTILGFKVKSTISREKTVFYKNNIYVINYAYYSI